MAITEFSKNYHEKMFPGWFDRLKRIKDACDKAGYRGEFETPDDGFVVVFYRYGIQKLSGTAQKEERLNALFENCNDNTR